MTDRYSTLRRGLVGAWCPSLGGDGALIRDRGPRRVNAVPSGTTYSALRGGVALTLPNSGVTGATVAGLDSVMAGATQGAISAWFSRTTTGPTGLGFTGLAPSNDPSVTRFGFIWWTDGNVYVSFGSTNTHSVSVGATSGTVHLAMAFNGALVNNAGRVVVWINGVSRTLSALATAPTALGSALSSFAIGRDSTERVCGGAIDDARLYSRAITDSEARLLASQRGIGLVPTRRRRARATTTMWLNVGGVWKKTTPHIRVGGVWKAATLKTRQGGTWRG